MALSITQRQENDVPEPNAVGRVNEDLETLKSEMRKLLPGMVLEIDARQGPTVRSTKTLITKAASPLGGAWQHWSVGTTVFAKPKETTRRRGRRSTKNG